MAKKRARKKTVVSKKSSVKTLKKNNKLPLVLIVVVAIVLFILVGQGANEIGIKEGDAVTLHYTGTLSDGSVFDTSMDKDPLVFVVGNRQLLPAFEKAVKGLKIGDKETIELSSDEAYGQRNESLTAEYPLENVPSDMEIAIGGKLFMQSPDGNVGIAVIKEIGEENLVLDLNHPLAGEDLKFEIEIIDVKEIQEL
jgi:peptidylprolyl isomerase